jgi:hypothetical protein
MDADRPSSTSTFVELRDDKTLDVRLRSKILKDVLLRLLDIGARLLDAAFNKFGLPRGGLHGFRRGCNRRWELAGLNPAVIRQQMGHTSARMTILYYVRKVDMCSGCPKSPVVKQQIGDVRRGSWAPCLGRREKFHTATTVDETACKRCVS